MCTGIPPTTWRESGRRGSRVADRPRQLSDTIPPGASLLIDSSVVLAYLAGGEPGSTRAEELFDAFVATGRNFGIPVDGHGRGDFLCVRSAAVQARSRRREAFLQHFGDLRLVPVTYDVAREAARLRASTDLPMPDALIVASAVVTGADLVVTDDRSWRPRLGDSPEIEVVQLTA